MSMKSYYRYRPSDVVGVITTPDCKAVYDYTGKLAFTSKIQDVGVWNVRQGNQIKSLVFEDSNYPYTNRGEVSTIARCPDQKSVCVGYTTGEVRVFNYITGAIVTTYRGHRSAVNAIALDTSANSSGSLLATGGADCDIVVWDQVASLGLVRFREHKDAVTALSFVNVDDRKFLVSVSKDTLLKVWDVDNKYCLQTIVGHRTEIWSLLVLHPTEAEYLRILTGSADEQVRAYALTQSVLTSEMLATLEGAVEENVLTYVGSLKRTNHGGNIDRCAGLTADSVRGLVAAQSSGKLVDIYRLRPREEAKKKTKKRLKRIEEKKSQGKVAAVRDADGILLDEEAGIVEHDTPILTEWNILDEIELIHTLRSAVRVKSFEFTPVPSSSSSLINAASTSEDATALVALANNSLESYKVPLVHTTDGLTKHSVVDFAGHRSDVRGLALTHDGITLATCSSESIKFWNSRSLVCTGSCRVSGFCLSIAFAPGGRYIVAGFKDGTIQIYDSASGEAVYTFHPSSTAENDDNSQNQSPSSSAAVYSIAVRPDGTGFVAAGADKTARFFRFIIQSAANSSSTGGAIGLQAQVTRELTLPSEVLMVKYSFHRSFATTSLSTSETSTSRSPLLVAMALLDHTVRIFYDDSLRLCLTLYGHTLPVLALDISDDNALVATGSADKTIKLWGLDFGDCHRSLFGHTDTVTAVKFVPKTHYFFSTSKDGSMKYWDGDRFEQILHLPGHKGTIWSLEVSLEGAAVFTAGQDRSLRRWLRDTDDLVFVEEEKERMLEAQVDQQAASQSNSTLTGAQGEVVVLDGDVHAANLAANAATGTAVVAQGSVASVKGGDLIMQTLDLVEESTAALDGDATKPSANPLLLGLSPLKYMQRCLATQIPRPDLESALLVLPITDVVRLLYWLLQLAEAGLDLETVARCCVFLVLCHQKSLSSQSSLLGTLLSLRDILGDSLASYRDLLGMNAAALRYVQRTIEEEREERTGLYEALDVSKTKVAENKKKKRTAGAGNSQNGQKRKRDN